MAASGLSFAIGFFLPKEVFGHKNLLHFFTQKIRQKERKVKNLQNDQSLKMHMKSHHTRDKIGTSASMTHRPDKKLLHPFEL